MMGFLYFWLIILGIAFLCLAQAAWSDHEEKKEAEERRIADLKGEIKKDLEKITDLAYRFGDKFYVSLMDFASKMEKLTEDDVKADLKPYDIYNVKHLQESFSGLGKLICRIVINKNLEPRFMASSPSTIPSRIDIQLEAALTIEEVKELADVCRRIKMDVDIEAYRKDKVRKAINNK
jgi:D-arabinose 1-dehydrogenase-like Zn-dependent alcohol dehydrogenase